MKYSDSTATVLYHTFTAMCYFSSILGAILADSYLGMFQAIFYLSVVFLFGEIILAVGAVGDTNYDNQGIEGLPAK